MTTNDTDRTAMQEAADEAGREQSKPRARKLAPMPTTGGGRPTAYKTKDGTRVPGVTTIIGRFKDSSALIHWAWAEGAAGRDYRKSRDDAGSVGHYTHALVEADIHGNALPPAPMGMSVEDVASANKGLQAFRDWKDAVKLEIVCTEMPAVSEMWRFGGTWDLLARVNGTMCMLDLKSSNGVYEDHLVQVAAYRQLARELGYGPDTGGLIRVGKLYGDFTFHSWPVEAMDDAWASFRYMLELYPLMGRIKKAVGR